MLPILPFVSGLNMMISSRRFKNSGRKCPLSSFMTASSHSGLISPLSSIPSSRCAEPRFDVIIMIVFLKSTVLPCESVIRPSSSTCNSTLNTSGCAFSTSSNSTTEYGFLRTASVSCPPSSYPTYPGGAPIKRETEYFSIYSLISRRTMLDSSSNRLAASAFASSVLPTPVGPKNRNEPIGFVGSLIPALERMIASVTFVTPSSCPMTRLCSSSSR